MTSEDTQEKPGEPGLSARKVVGGRVYCRVENLRTRPAYRGAKTGSFFISLACGNSIRRKMSDGCGKYALCRFCDDHMTADQKLGLALSGAITTTRRSDR